MGYQIVKNAPKAQSTAPSRKTAEREAMEQLDVGDAFYVRTHEAKMRAHYARYQLLPSRFTIVKILDEATHKVSWQIRREE